VGRENKFKPTIENESPHQVSNDNGVRTVNFATSKNLVVNTLRMGSFKLFKRPFPGFLTILTL